MNQKVEEALIDYSNDVWDRAMKAGAGEERERIIKLLEDAMLEQDEPITKDFAIGAIWAVNEAIALIKGEK